MLMKDDKRKMATVIVSKLKDGSDKMQEAPEKDGAEQESDELSLIADDILRAIEAKDTRALRDSLKAMVECCSEYESEDSEE